MAMSARRDFGDMLSLVGEAWGWILAFGLVSIVAGGLAIIFSGTTLLVIAVLFGIQLILVGIFRFVGALAIPAESGWIRALAALLGVLSFIVGIYLIRHPFFSLLVLAILLGIYWIIHGVIDLYAAIAHREMRGRGWTSLTGVLSLIAGFVVLFYPGISLLALTIVLGAWLVIYGVILVVTALQIRSAVAHGQEMSGKVSPA